MLDVGTGSGILAIAALKLGASEALGTELDGHAAETARENGALNGAGDRFQVAEGNILEDAALQRQAGEEAFDLAVSNILAPVIVRLAGEIGRHLKHGGVWISSGIIEDKAADVRQALEARPEWEILEEARQGEWVSFTARRK